MHRREMLNAWPGVMMAHIASIRVHLAVMIITPKPRSRRLEAI